MLRSLTTGLVLGAALLAGTGCGSGGSEQAQTSNQQASLSKLAVGWTGTAVNSLDPAKGDRNLASLGLETLLRLTPDGKLEPWLARSVTQPDARTYVYSLRPGVRFWNGNPLTAADVANSLNYQRRPGAFTAYAYTNVASVTADGTSRVVVKLTKPSSDWPYDAAGFAALIWEKKFQDENKSTFGKPGTLIMGTGAWKFTGLQPGSGGGAQLTANPDYWGEKVAARELGVTFFADENSEALAFRSGEIQLTNQVANPKAFAATAGTSLERASGPEHYLFSMNVTQGPWSDIHVRRAVAYAINRDDVVEALGGYGSPQYTLIPDFSLETISSPDEVRSLLDSVPLYEFDVEKAKAELAQSRYPDGFSATIPEPTDYYSSTQLSQVIAGNLAKIGIKLKIQGLPLTQYWPLMTGPAEKRPATFIAGNVLDPTPAGSDYWLGSWNTKPGLYNIANYGPPSVDELLTQAGAAPNTEGAFAAWSKIVERLQTDLPYVGVAELNNAVALADNLEFSAPLGPFSFFSNSWISNVRAK